MSINCKDGKWRCKTVASVTLGWLLSQNSKFLVGTSWPFMTNLCAWKRLTLWSQKAFWHSAIYSIGWIIGFMWRPCQHDLYISLSSHHSLHRPHHPAWSFLLTCPQGDLQGTQVLQLRLPAKNLHQRAPSNWAKWRNVFVQLAGAYSRFQLRLVTTSATEKERCSALKVDKNQCVRWGDRTSHKISPRLRCLKLKW